MTVTWPVFNCIWVYFGFGLWIWLYTSVSGFVDVTNIWECLWVGGYNCVERKICNRLNWPLIRCSFIEIYLFVFRSTFFVMADVETNYFPILFNVVHSLVGSAVKLSLLFDLTVVLQGNSTFQWHKQHEDGCLAEDTHCFGLKCQPKVGVGERALWIVLLRWNIDWDANHLTNGSGGRITFPLPLSAMASW